MAAFGHQYTCPALTCAAPCNCGMSRPLTDAEVNMIAFPNPTPPPADVAGVVERLRRPTTTRKYRGDFEMDFDVPPSPVCLEAADLLTAMQRENEGLKTEAEAIRRASLELVEELAAERSRAEALQAERDRFRERFNAAIEAGVEVEIKLQAAEAQLSALQAERDGLREALAGSIRWIELICHEADIEPEDTTIDVRANAVIVATLNLAESLANYRPLTKAEGGGNE